MIGQQEEATLKGVVSKLAKDIEQNNERLKALEDKVDGVVAGQGDVNSSLQDLANARRTGTPIQVMKAEVVEKTIEDKLTTQLVGTTVPVDVRNATIGKESKEKIDGLMESTGSLITAAEHLVESNKAIKPRKPLLNLTVNGDKKLLWIAFGLVTVFTMLAMGVIIWANNKVASIQDDLQNQPSYWGDRAYQAMLQSDDTDPGKAYHLAFSHFDEQPDKVKKYVEKLELEAEQYQEWKQYLLSFIGKKDSRDIRVLAWEIDHGEGWFLYRFYDEETERSVHVWPDKKVEETTDKNVTDLASAQKYSKRKIWTVIREAPSTMTE